MSTSWMAQQLLTVDPRPLSNQIPRYNPRPAGVIREGSATQAVLVYLRSINDGGVQPARWVTHRQIRVAVNRSSKSVDFGLAYLRAMKLIDVTVDEPRNSRYLRYRAVAV